MKEYNYISVLDGFLRAKIYLWMINVILYVGSFRVAKFFLMAGILLMGVSILCSSAINRKRWITSWMISFCACFIYLICYILEGYAGVIIPMGGISEADSNPANGIVMMLYTAAFWGTAVAVRIVSGIFCSVMNKSGSSRRNTYLWEKRRYCKVIEYDDSAVPSFILQTIYLDSNCSIIR